MGLFGKDRTNVVEGVINIAKKVTSMIDDSKFTAEERARYGAKAADSLGEFVKETMSENTERSRARRNIAEWYLLYFLALFTFLIVSWKYDSKWFEAVKDLAIQFNLPVAFILVMTFFFGGYYLNKFAGSKTKK